MVVLECSSKGKENQEELTIPTIGIEQEQIVMDKIGISDPLPCTGSVKVREGL